MSDKTMQTKTSLTKTLLTSAIASVLLSPAIVWAEESDLILEEVLVTAQKREENITDVPISITVVSAETLDKRGITDTSELAKVVPGFVYQSSTFGSPIYYIRGIGFAEITQAVSPAVSIYVDQIPLPFSVMARGAILDLQSVEALKGPQGTLFGQNSTGGAINYIAAKPTEEFTGGFDLSYGRFNDIEIGGFVSGALGDTLKARASVRSESRGNWQQSSSRNDELGERDFNTWRVLLDWAPSDNVDFLFNVNGWQDKSDSQANQFIGFRFLVPCPGPGRQAACDALEAQPISPATARAADWDPGRSFAVDDDFYQVSLQSNWQASDNFALTSQTSYSKYDSLAPFDTDGMAYTNLTVEGDIDIESFNQELRVNGELENGVIWMLGGNYQKSDSSEVQLSILGSTNSAGFDGLISRNAQDVSSKAMFASVEVPLGDKFKISTSARYTSEDRDFSGCAQDDGNGGLAALLGIISNLRTGLPPIPPRFIAAGGCVTLNSDTSLPIGGLVTQSLSEDNISWRASLDYKPNADTLLYLTGSKGYKSGSYPLVPGVFDDQFIPATQESVLAYELGLKKTLANQRVQLNSALYYYNYDDKQVRGFLDVGFPFGNVPALVNVPKSRAWGFETEITAILMDGLQVSGAVNYIDTKVTEDFYTPDPLGDIFNINGEAFPMAPKWQLSMDIEYSFPIGEALVAFFGISPSYRSATKAAFGTNPLLAVDSYTLLDLRAGIESEVGDWRAEVFARNVTDQFYWTQITREIDALTRTVGMPATYGVRVSYRY
ncbi:MAG: TonB-dependent receptor [Xanthomonadales bacterium]|nr:TonB-dependent receptor [Xanthomonadales bacterium]